MTYIDRLQSVLAETCRELKVNGLTEWEPHDFYDDAKRVVSHLKGIAIIGDAMGVTTREDVLSDMLDARYGVAWSIPDQYVVRCAEACLEELYDELLGDSRWSSGV